MKALGRPAPRKLAAKSSSETIQLRRRRKKKFINKKDAIFHGSLQEFHRKDSSGRTGWQRALDEWHNPSPKYQLDLVGWHPNPGWETNPHGFGHMSYRRNWKRRNKSGQRSFEDIRQDSPVRKMGPTVTIPGGNAPPARRFDKMRVGYHPTNAEHRARMAGRSSGHRYHQTSSTTVNLSKKERVDIDRRLAHANAYHLYKEASRVHCNAARCMSPAEWLMQSRHQATPAPPYNPHELIADLAQQNPRSASAVRTDPVAAPERRHSYWPRGSSNDRVPAPPKGWLDD